jgi:hypothetical protein
VTLSTSRPWIVPGLAAFLLLALVPHAPLHAQALGKWGPGEKPSPNFEVGGNPEAKHGSPDAGFIRSVRPAPDTTGYLRTQLAPAPYLGKRVRLSGFVKTEFTDGAAALSIRVDGPGGARLARDAMYGRELRGTNDWKRCDVVVDVPSNATNIVLSMYAFGVGRALVDGLTFEVVGTGVPLTDWPGRWSATGTNPEDYEMGGDPLVAHGAAGGGYLRSAAPAPRTFAAFAGVTEARPFLGRRLRLSAFVRAEGVQGWSGLCLRIDGPNGTMLGFDNMGNRPIKGTADWKRYDVVLDVPANAVGVFYGIILEGSGRTWIDGVTLEPVGTDVSSTSMANPFTEYFEGRYAEAARVFADAIKNSPDNYMASLFYALALHRSGRPEEARTFLAGITGKFPVQKWPGPVVQFYAGRLHEDEVLKAAASADPKIDKEQRCEAYDYLAMAYLLKLGGVQGDAPSNASKAQEYLEKCVATGVTNFVEYLAAQAELGRLKK